MSQTALLTRESGATTEKPRCMDRIVVDGGKRLIGDARIGGSKNSALALMAAALCVEGTTVFDNVPDIGDVRVLNAILSDIGCKISWSDHRLRIDTSTLRLSDPSSYLVDLVLKMRASFNILGPLLARFGFAKVPFPGGCAIGTRAVDYHIKGFQQMGANVIVEHGFVVAESRGRLHGAQILLDGPSVGATNHLLSTAVLAEGRTVIENAAKEPEIIDLACFLNAMGAKVEGAGTKRIVIEGVDRLNPVRHQVIPDRIEAATLAVAGAITRGDILLRGVVEDHLTPIICKLRDCGVDVRMDSVSPSSPERDASYPVLGNLRVRMDCRPHSVHLTASPHPGFPTDAHPMLAAMLTLADGAAMITETVYDRRFAYCAELQRMGANISISNQVALVEGVERLTGAQVAAPDLRGGAALVLAGLVAHGRTEVNGLEYIDRGYEQLEKKLKRLGARILRTGAETVTVPRTALCTVS